jgi:zinc protease
MQRASSRLFLELPSWPEFARLYAQESIETPPSKVERKNQAPVSREVLRVKLPKPIEAKLKNGLRVLILEDHRTPSVFVELHIGGAGALYEPSGITGLANATAQMLREGTKARTSVQIAEEIDRLGASLGAAVLGSSQVMLTPRV